MIKNCIDRPPLPETFVNIPCPTLTDKKLGCKKRPKKRLWVSCQLSFGSSSNRGSVGKSVVSFFYTRQSGREKLPIAHRSIVYTRFLGSVKNCKSRINPFSIVSRLHHFCPGYLIVDKSICAFYERHKFILYN